MTDRRWVAHRVALLVVMMVVTSVAAASRGGVLGYYRLPTIHDDQVVFTAEGDLWKVSTSGGLAVRLTSHPAGESFPHFSPDGKQIAFTADYEGNSDIYVMSSDGGEPKRLTFHPSREECVGWMADGKSVLFRTRRSGLDSDSTLYKVPADGGEPEMVKIGVCEAASFSPDGKMVAFNPFLWNGTWKRYRGGTAAKIWVGDLSANKFWKISKEEAVDQYPMIVGDRVYFISERAFPVNIWSCKLDGSDAKQITKHGDYDVRSADSDGKSIVYTVAADLYVMDVKSGQSKKIDTTLPSDRIRERTFVPSASMTIENYELSNDGKRVAVSSRGEIWNAPTKPGGRIIQVTDNDSGIRQREPVFSPDGKKICCITDETGEQELALYDAAGKEPHKILTKGGKGWLFGPSWSDDSKYLAYADLTDTLYVVDAEKGDVKSVDTDKNWEITEYTFSPDSKWIAYTKNGDNRNAGVWIYEIATGKTTMVSSGFTNDFSPTWDPKGKLLYFISNRVFRPYLDELDANFLVTKSGKPCVVILEKDGKSPLLPEEMLDQDKDKDKDKDKSNESSTTKPSTTKPTTPAEATTIGGRVIRANDLLDVIVFHLVAPGRHKEVKQRVDANGNITLPLAGQVHVCDLSEAEAEAVISKAYRDANIIENAVATVTVFRDDDEKGSEDDKDKQENEAKERRGKLFKMKIDLEGIQQRVVELPVSADNCGNLYAAESKLFWMTTPTRGMGEDGDDDRGGDSPRADAKVHCYDFKKRKEETFIDGVRGFRLSGDTKRIAWTKGNREILIADVSSKPGNEIEEKVQISDLPLQVNPIDEWKQIYTEAWRLQRDFYWAENMVGVDWPAMRKKYEVLLDRVATRGELNDVIGQLIGELGTSHTYVFGGDSSFQPPRPVRVGMLGADVEVDKGSGLHKFVKVYRAEPWEGDTVSPLAMSHANVKEGDYLLAINGRELKPNDNVDSKLINLSDVQVLLSVCSKPDKSDARDIQIKTLASDTDLRYADWCRRNREYVDAKTSGKVGYFHLPDMSAKGLIKFIEDFYPQINKDALIIDDRSNHGGFVSQMLIEKLKRQPWAYDRPRRGMVETYPQRVHLGYKCVLTNEHAGSDGDIFPDSFRTWGLGPIIGKRTWGGVIGIRMDKRFIDSGMSSQPEFAWFDAKRGWSIENHGVDPDIEVEFTPQDYINSVDPQLDRGIDEMMKKIHEKPIERPQPPPFPVRYPKENTAGGGTTPGASAR